VKKFLLDSNVFIQAHRMYYPFDVFPSFWDKLIELSNNGKIFSIDKVKKELCDNPNEDDLSIWCNQTINSTFFCDSSASIDKYMLIAKWTNEHKLFQQNAKDEFLATDLADPWLIAYALKNDCIIVTNETSQPNRKNKIKIPEPCDEFGVQYMSPIQMLRDLKETL
jgi:hypothetical protein